MIDQELAKTSKTVFLDILGIIRPAQPAPQGGWDVEACHRNGTDYMSYHTFNGVVVWDVAERGGYPDLKEFAALEAAA